MPDFCEYVSNQWCYCSSLCCCCYMCVCQIYLDFTNSLLAIGQSNQHVHLYHFLFFRPACTISASIMVCTRTKCLTFVWTSFYYYYVTAPASHRIDNVVVVLRCQFFIVGPILYSRVQCCRCVSRREKRRYDKMGK